MEEGSVDGTLLAKRNRRSDTDLDKKDIKHVLTGEGFSDHRDILMLKAVNPIYVCFTIFGLIWTNKGQLFSRSRGHGKWCSVSWRTLHCCIVIVSAWFLGLKQVAVYQSSDRYGSELFLKICFQLIDLQFACGITANVYFIQKCAPDFVKLWENYKIKHGGVPFGRMKRKNLVIMISINMATILIASTIHSLGLIMEPTFFSESLFPILTRWGIEVPFWLTVIVTFYYFYLTMAWLQSFLFCICLNCNLREEFQQLSEQFDQEMDGTKSFSSIKPRNKIRTICKTELTTSNKSLNQTEPYRQRYLELCTLVSTFDDVISSYLLSIYLFSIPLIVIFLYILWGFKDNTSQNNLTTNLMMFSSFIFYVTIVVAVTGFASRLTSSAQKVKSVLYSVDVTKCSTEEGISVQLFLHKVSSDHIGLTIWKFLNIDKRMLITMFTIVITYLTVLIKFALAFGSVSVIELTECPCLNVTTQAPG